MQQHKYSEALLVLQTKIKQQDVNKFLIKCYVKLGQYSKALEDIQKQLIQEENFEKYYCKAKILMK